MGNVEGLKAYPVTRWGGSADWDDPAQIPLGLAVICRNCRFQVEGVGTRFGSRHTMQTSGVGDFTGVEVLQVLGSAAQQIPVVYSDTGVLLRETPPGSGTLVPVNPPMLLPASASMLTSKAYNSIYAAFSDLETPLIPPLVLNGVTGALNPVSQNPIGSLWTPGQFAQIGDLVRSSLDPTRWFRCTSPGKMSETEPTWPTLYGSFQPAWVPATAQDQGGGRSTWEEWTPIATSELPQPVAPTTLVQNAGVGTIPANKDVYFKASYVVNEGAIVGETALNGPTIFLGTAGNAQIAFQWGANPSGGPVMPSWMSMIIKQSSTFQPFELRVYVAAVAHGAAAPAANLYKWAGDFDVTKPVVISAIPQVAAPATSGPALITFLSTVVSTKPISHVQQGPGDTPVQLPQVSQTTAFIPPGFIGTAGPRKMMVLRQDAQGSLSPVDPNSVLSVNFDGFGQANIITLVRNSAGTVNALVSDTTSFIVGGQVSANGVADPTFDGAFTVTGVSNGTYPVPQGVITWSSGVLSVANSTGGTLTGIAGNLPVAFIPPGGNDDSIDIAAFSVQGASAGGPFFFIDQADPPGVIVLQIRSLQRTSGIVTATLVDASAVSSGTDLAIAGFESQPSLAFDGLVSVGTVNKNVITYAQPGNNTSLITGGTATIVQELPTAAVNPPGGSVGIPLNFDDNFLSNAIDVTNQLTAIPAPPSTHIYFSPSLRKLVYTTGKDSNHYFSDTDDPANIQNPDGILSVENNNGSKTVAFAEMISGELLSLKQNGGYAIQVGADNPPSQWTPTRRWDGHGPCGPQAFAVGPDFLIIFDENSGPYRYYQGALSQIGHEKQGTWDRINKDAKKQVCVEIDDDLKRVHFLLPLDGATVPNKELTLDYFNGWEEPVVINFAGELIPNRYGRRWSEDDRLARVLKRLKRELANPIDQRIDHRQMLYAMENPLLTSTVSAEAVQLDSATNSQPILPFGDYYIQVAKVVDGVETEYTRVMGPFQVTQVLKNGETFWQVIQVNLPADGAEDSWNVYIGFTQQYNQFSPPFNQVVSAPNNVSTFLVTFPGPLAVGPTGTMSVDMTVPDTYDDSGVAIDSQYQPAFFTDPELKIIEWQSLKGRATGIGNMIMQLVTEDGSQATKVLTVDLDGSVDPPGKFFRGFGPIQNELLSIMFTNGKVAGAAFLMQAFVLYGIPKYPARKG